MDADSPLVLSCVCQTADKTRCTKVHIRIFSALKSVRSEINHSLFFVSVFMFVVCNRLCGLRIIHPKSYAASPITPFASMVKYGIRSVLKLNELDGAFGIPFRQCCDFMCHLLIGSATFQNNGVTICVSCWCHIMIR